MNNYTTNNTNETISVSYTLESRRVGLVDAVNNLAAAVTYSYPRLPLEVPQNLQTNTTNLDPSPAVIDSANNQSSSLFLDPEVARQAVREA